MAMLPGGVLVGDDAPQITARQAHAQRRRQPQGGGPSFDGDATGEVADDGDADCSDQSKQQARFSSLPLGPHESPTSPSHADLEEPMGTFGSRVSKISHRKRSRKASRRQGGQIGT